MPTGAGIFNGTMRPSSILCYNRAIFHTEGVLAVSTTHDPFRHGWRYVQVTRPDGSVDFDQVPLTMEDVLHPEEGDKNLYSDMHTGDCHYLRYVLDTKLADKPSALVLTYCRVDFGIPGVRPLGPDT